MTELSNLTTTTSTIQSTSNSSTCNNSKSLPVIFGERNFDWEEVSSPSSSSTSSNDISSSASRNYTRNLGPTEISYYLGSRGDEITSGVNDMYLHIGFKALKSLVAKERILLIWTELITRHNLLVSEIVFEDYDNIKFLYRSPGSFEEAKAKAKTLLEFRTNQDPKELLNEYLNGPRTLSDTKLSTLIISTPSSTFSSSTDSIEEGLEEEVEQEFDFYLFCTHFLGDGMALHSTANEFFTLLSSSTSTDAAQVVVENIEKISSKRIWNDEKDIVRELPGALESQLITNSNWKKLAWSVAKVEFQNHERRYIGGQSFPKSKLGPRQTIVPTISYTIEETKKILVVCKKNNSTISNAIFALCNFAWIRSSSTLLMSCEDEEREREKEPCMMYSALNIRPFLKKNQEQERSDWYHIAIGYYNIILPSYLPSLTTSPNDTIEEIKKRTTQLFWSRTQSTRIQTSKIVKSKWLNSRVLLMALERESRSIGWEKADDEKREKEGNRVEGGVEDVNKLEEVEVKGEVGEKKKAEVPLLGVSMLGNLDAMYSHSNYHGIKLHTLTTGSRQRPSSLLLFAYTFCGKLWFSLGYDKNGFKEGVVENWWKELQGGVEEFLLV